MIKSQNVHTVKSGGSDLCPCGRGGIFFSRGSFLFEPRPYKGITCSRVIGFLHTGQVGLIGFVSNH